MAYEKTTGYETARETSLETSVKSGSVTTKSTRNEYSVPFNNFSAANHLITAFTLSGVTLPAGGEGDSCNGVYTITDNRHYTNLNAGNNHRWVGPTGNKFEAVVNPTTFYWEFSDTDYYPYSESSSRAYPVGEKNSVAFTDDFSLYPWQDDYTMTWSDNELSDFSLNGVFSNPVGSDFE